MNIGEFYNVTEIGHGGMGTVYQGYAPNGQKVAIKEIRHDFISEAELVKRFEQEARVIDKLNHPSIVRIVKPTNSVNNRYYPAFECQGNIYMAMEFVEGQTLGHYVKQYSGGLPETEAVSIMCNILEAMEYVSNQGLVHRDIKPSNIIIKPDKTICLIDFGIVKDTKSVGVTTGSSVIGTSGYMSPEQAQGGMTIDMRTDVYSLGCVLFYMLTGVHAYKTLGSEYETKIAILKDAFPRAKDYNPNISDKIQAILDKAVQKNMLNRFQTPGEFRRALLSDPEVSTVAGTEDLMNLEGQLYTGNTTITIGRDPTCDLVVYDDRNMVSRKHLTIKRRIQDHIIEYIFEDTSTNGTTVDNKYIKHNNISVVVNDSENYNPQINLGGSQILDWSKVFVLLSSQSEQKLIDSADVSVTESADKVSVVDVILSLLFPIVGVVLFAVYRKTSPQKARIALIVSVISFVLYIVFKVCLEL